MHKWDKNTLGAAFTCTLEPWREKNMYIASVSSDQGDISFTPNGCDDYSPCPECEECLKRSMIDFKEWVTSLSSDTPDKK